MSILNGKQAREFANFFNTYKIDIVLMSETHFLPSHDYKIVNYDIYRTDRETDTTGGAAIIICSSIPHFIAPYSQNPRFETVAIKVAGASGECLKFISAYRRPNMHLTVQNIECVFFEDVPTVFGGDLNAKNRLWHSSTEKRSGILPVDYAEGWDDFLVIGPRGHPPPVMGARRRLWDVLDMAIPNNTELTYNTLPDRENATP